MTTINQTAIGQRLMQFFQQGAWQKGIELFETYTSLNKADPLCLQLYALCLRKIGKHKDSDKAYSKAIKRFPSYPDLRNSYANLLIELKKFDLASTQLDAALKLNPSLFEALLNKGRLCSQQKDYKKAKTCFSKALSLKPNHVDASVGLAEACMQLKDLAGAESIYTGLLSANIVDLKVLNNLATIKRKLGKYQEAIAILRRLTGQFGWHPGAQRNLAACLVLALEYDEALGIYVALLEKEPHDPQLHEEIIHVLWVQDDEKPFQFIEKHLGEVGQNLPLWLKYISLLIQADKFEDAKSLSQTLYKKFPSAPEVLLNLATLLRQNGEVEQAVTLNRKALAKMKNDTGAMNELGYSLLSAGQFREAQGIYKTLCSREKLNQGWFTLWSTCLRETADWSKYAWLCDYNRLVHKAKLQVSENWADTTAFNTALMGRLLELHSSYRHPIGQSLRNGTQTFEDLFDSNDPIIVELREGIKRQVADFVAQQTADKKHPFLSRLCSSQEFIGSWSVCLRSTGFHKSHFHPEGWLSGVYYVDLPSEVEINGQGWLVFGKPEIPCMEYPGDFAIKPEKEHMVLFPSFMWHGTLPFVSSERRLTVAFDIVPA